MARHRIGWLPGDGIGPEVLASARAVLDATGLDAEHVQGDIGWEFWKREGTPLPDRTVEMLGAVDCALLGAVTSKPDPDARAELRPALRKRGVSYSGAVLRLRKMFDLYTCLRPCKSYPGNPHNFREGIDIVLFRENTEGLYFGVEWERAPDGLRGLPGGGRIPPGAAVSARVVTERASERIAEAAFAFALERGRRRVTAVHKASVLRATCGLFLQAARRVARDHPGIEYEEMNVDACAMHLVRDPLHFDVILTTNLFGDILSDLGAQLAGGLGLAPSGNIGPDMAVFEPVHGSAPDIAGKGIANPLGAMLSAGMMLEWLGETARARAIEEAVSGVILQGKVRTPDLGGDRRTADVTRAVVRRLRELRPK